MRSNNKRGAGSSDRKKQGPSSRSNSKKTSRTPFKRSSENTGSFSDKNKGYRGGKKRESESESGEKPFVRKSESEKKLRFAKPEGESKEKRTYSKVKSDFGNSSKEKGYRGKSKDSGSEFGEKPFIRTKREPSTNPRFSKSESENTEERSFSRTKSSDKESGSYFKNRKSGESKEKTPIFKRTLGSGTYKGRGTTRKNEGDVESTSEKERQGFLPYKRKIPGAKPTNTHRSRAKSPSNKEDDGLIRLNRYIANTGICSRREADELIAAGAVMVNGKVVTEMGFKVSQEDEVRYGGETIRKERLVYVLLNKPKDFITTTDDPQNRRTVMSLVQDACRERIYPVGRLDRETTGLLLLTNDGELTKKLTHPAYEIKKIYHVELDKALKIGDFKKITEGLELEDGFVKVDELEYVGASKNEVGVELHSGKNRIVRRIFDSLEYRVKKLDRVYFAGLTKKDLARGRWRFLTEMEINMLKMITGKKKKLESF